MPSLHGLLCASHSFVADHPDEPPPTVDIKFHQAFISHLQEEGLAGLLIGHIGTLHDFKDFKRLLAKRIQNFLSVVQHRSLMTISDDAPS
jgi:hypothetical protein